MARLPSIPAAVGQVEALDGAEVDLVPSQGLNYPRQLALAEDRADLHVDDPSVSVGLEDLGIDQILGDPEDWGPEDAPSSRPGERGMRGRRSAGGSGDRPVPRR